MVAALATPFTCVVYLLRLDHALPNFTGLLGSVPCFGGVDNPNLFQSFVGDPFGFGNRKRSMFFDDNQTPGLRRVYIRENDVLLIC